MPKPTGEAERPDPGASYLFEFARHPVGPGALPPSDIDPSLDADVLCSTWNICLLSPE